MKSGLTFFSKWLFYGSMLLLILCFSGTIGCVPLWLGAGAAGGYVIASDERSVSQRIDDSVITARIKSKLLADSRVKALKIDVDTLEGEVTLTGIVGSQEEVKAAVEIANSVKGVIKVKDNLKVK